MPQTLLNHWKSLGPFARWPLRGRELTAAFLRLGQKLFQPQIVNQPHRLSVALVSACAGLHTQEMRSSAQRIFGHYADKHGYDLHFFMDAMDVLRNLEMNITLSNSPAFWRASKFRKISAETLVCSLMLPHCIPMEYILKSQPFHCFIDVANSTQFTHHHDHWPHRYAGVPQAYALRSVLERFANYDWFLWLDCDIIITDVTQRVESILASPLDEAKETCPVKQPRLWAFRACCLKQEFALRRDRCILPRNVDAKHQRWSFFFFFWWWALRQTITDQYRSCNLWIAHDVDQCRSMGDSTWSDFAKRWWLLGVEQGISTDFWTKNCLANLWCPPLARPIPFACSANKRLAWASGLLRLGLGVWWFMLQPCAPLSLPI